MEVIRIPEVSLVDATGRRIGVYTDDPDWWQQLKQKDQSNMITQNDEPSQTLIRQKTRDHFASSTTSMKAKLISFDDKEKTSNNSMIMKNIAINNNEENLKECNVIGETPLHIAIMYDDLNTIKLLIEKKGFDVNERNIGGKFTGGFNSRQTSSLIQQSKYEGLAYYGEYPLAFAACFANKEIYDYLIQKGADPNLQDSNGNTVLHVLVINNKLDMFQYATNHQLKKASHGIKNNQDLTPINLAAKLGRGDLFEKMLELRNIEFWRYSNITCSAYPLEGLDSIDSDGKVAWNAALSYIVNGNTDGHLDMLEIGVVSRLLGDKWETFAKTKLFYKIIFSFFHLLLLTIAVYTRANDRNNLWIWPPVTSSTYARYISELFLVCLSIIQLFFNGQEINAQGFVFYLKNLQKEPANVFYLAFNILLVLCVPFRFVTFSSGSTVTARNVEDTLFIICIPCGWMHILFYARVFPLTGPFVVMIYKMIVGDILTFASIYVLLLFGFSLAFYYLYKNVGEGIVTMDSYIEALMISFQMTLGEFKARLPEFDKIYYADFTKTVFIAFMLMMHILLLNMLIAMMGNTYHQITKKSEKEWRKQWAGVILLLERSYTPDDLKKFQNKYAITLPTKQPGLMVIRKIEKTRAFQKTMSIRNWKKFYKNVLHLLKENKFDGVDLLHHWSQKDHKENKKKHLKEKKDFDWSNYAGNPAAPKQVFSKILEAPKEKPNPISKEPPKEPIKELPKPIPKEITKEMSKEKPKEPPKEQPKEQPKETVKEPLKKETASKPPAPPKGAQTKTDSKPASKKDNVVPVSTLTNVAEQKQKTNDTIKSTSSNYFIPPPNDSQPSFVRSGNKITFYPVQTNKIYPQLTNSFSSVPSSEPGDNYDKMNRQNSLSLVDDGSKLDFIDVKRPLSSVKHNPEGYLKQETYPKFPQVQSTENKNTDTESENSDVLLKTRTSPDGDEEKEKDHKL